MNISPIASYSPSFGAISKRAVENFVKQHAEDEEALDEFSKTIMEQSLNENYHIDYYKDLGLYAVVTVQDGKIKSAGFKPTQNIFSAAMDANEAEAQDLSYEENKILKEKRAEFKKLADIDVIDKIGDNKHNLSYLY